MRRLDRKRLFEVEKLGQDIDAGTSPLMKKALVSATQHREGQKLVTDLVFDLGTSKVSLISGGDESAHRESIGAGSDAAYLCQLTEATFGAVTSVETVCLEAFVGSAGALAGSGSLDLLQGADAAGVLNGQPGTPVTLTLDIGTATGKHTIALQDDKTTLANKYLYFTLGDEAGTDVATATATITVTDTDVTNMTNGMTHVRLTKADGTIVDFQANSGADFDAVNTTNNSFNIGGTVNTAAKVAQGISIGIHGNASVFTTDASSRGGSSATITVTQTAAGENGNRTNFFVDAPGKTAGVTVGNFTGGTTKGDALPITAGKFLIRVTGFVAPDDL
tara:strand:- start:237 stop:1238 length:1002 start_codon:yes stop_codon:yes gene_type:complete